MCFPFSAFEHGFQGVTELPVNVVPINGIILLCAAVYHRDTR